jgi:hypothetical protein
VPFRLLKNFHKIQQRLVRELEKKFSGKDVVLVANRRIMPPPTSGKGNARPRSRTLTAVRGVGGTSAWLVEQTVGCVCGQQPPAGAARAMASAGAAPCAAVLPQRKHERTPPAAQFHCAACCRCVPRGAAGARRHPG